MQKQQYSVVANLSKSSNKIIKQLHARLLRNSNNVGIESVINNCKNNSSLCCGQSKLASLMNFEYYFRYFTFGNELENIGNMYMKMAIHTMHTDTITKHAYMCICATFTIHAYIY